MLLALVLSKLKLKVFLSTRDSLQRGEWDFELVVTHRANRDRGSSSQPLEHSKIVLRHGLVEPASISASSLRFRRSSRDALVLRAAWARRRRRQFRLAPSDR